MLTPFYRLLLVGVFLFSYGIAVMPQSSQPSELAKPALAAWTQLVGDDVVGNLEIGLRGAALQVGRIPGEGDVHGKPGGESKRLQRLTPSPYPPKYSEGRHNLI